MRTFVLFLSTIPYTFMGIRMEMGHDSLLHLLLAAFALLGMLEGVRASSECREWTYKDAGQSFGTGCAD
jgi:hypothetical protein